MIRRTVLSLPLALFSAHALAGTLACEFTEPFFSIGFDSKTGAVTFASPDEADPDTGRIVPKIIAEGARLRSIEDSVPPRIVLEADDTTLLDITISGRGSDGMSARLYPMEGVYGRFAGGCEASLAASFDLYDLYEDLGIAF